MIFAVDFLGNFMLSIAQLISWKNILLSNKKIATVNVILQIIFLTIVITFNHIYTNNFIKGFIIIILAIIFCRSIMKITYKESIILVFINQIIIIVAESVLFLLLNLFFNYDANYISNSLSITLMLDAFISFITVILSRVKILRKLYTILNKLTDYIKLKQVLILIFFVVLGTNIFSSSIYFNENIVLKIVLNVFISLIYTIIIVLVFKYQTKFYKLDFKYKMSLDDLQAQEALIDEYRILNHENDNQLQTIKSISMDSKVNQYIDSLIKKKKRLKSKIIVDVLKIPQGGIRGLIYNKIIIMNDYKIKYKIFVDKNLSSNNFLNLPNEDIVDICNVLGVYLDNAIEECYSIENGVINISFSLINSKINISISNSHQISDIDSQKSIYLKSKKGKDRGYGLKLAQRIIDNNPRISNKREINKNTFIQNLIIKIREV